MNLKHVIESWRDEEYRENLDAESRVLLPENPAGEIELSEADLADVDGGVTYTRSWVISIEHTFTLF